MEETRTFQSANIGVDTTQRLRAGASASGEGVRFMITFQKPLGDEPTIHKLPPTKGNDKLADAPG